MFSSISQPSLGILYNTASFGRSSLENGSTSQSIDINFLTSRFHRLQTCPEVKILVKVS